MEKRQLLSAIIHEIGSLTGRYYSIDLEPLDVRTLHQLLQILRDATAELSELRRRPLRP